MQVPVSGGSCPVVATFRAIKRRTGCEAGAAIAVAAASRACPLPTAWRSFASDRLHDAGEELHQQRLLTSSEVLKIDCGLVEETHVQVERERERVFTNWGEVPVMHPLAPWLHAAIHHEARLILTTKSLCT